jgi:hypothetical protein
MEICVQAVHQETLENNILIPRHFCESLIGQNDHKRLQKGKRTPSELIERLRIADRLVQVSVS